MPEIPEALVGCGEADVAWLDQRGLLLSSLGMKLDLLANQLWDLSREIQRLGSPTLATGLEPPAPHFTPVRSVWTIRSRHVYRLYTGDGCRAPGSVHDPFEGPASGDPAGVGGLQERLRDRCPGGISVSNIVTGSRRSARRAA
jgi:hypothetical protein